MLNESLKQQEGEFKQNCKRQLGKLQAELAKAKQPELQSEEVR
jgi:hypothetical protein